MHHPRHTLLALILSPALTFPTFSQTAAPPPPSPIPAQAEPAAPTPPTPIRIGDKAPPLAVGSWIKGAPLTAFPADRATVVEFWATWCKPCIMGMPHLSELQKKHAGKLTIVGVSVWENSTGAQTHDAMTSKVRAFVEAGTPAMDYTVAVDTDKNTMATTWLAAAGRNSIPSAFIVTSAGEIAWIGNPLTPAFDIALDKVLAGTFDVKAEARRAADEEAADARYEAAMTTSRELQAAGKPAEAVAAIDAALKEEADPSRRPSLLRTKFNLLAAHDEPAAYSFARGLLEGEFKDSDGELSLLCEQIAGNDLLKIPDHALAVRIGERAREVAAGKNPAALHRLALAYFKAGKTTEALAAQEEAITLWEAQVGKEKAALMVTIMRARIDDWKKALVK